MKIKNENLVELLFEKAQEKKEEVLYTFLLDGETEEATLTYQGLHNEASRVAALLQNSVKSDERALLLYPPSLDYISAFFGCLYARVVAVPAYPPDANRLARTLPRLLSIIRDSEAKVILTTQMIKSMAEFLFQEAPELTQLQWIATDEVSDIKASDYRSISIKSQDLAFLQYTSGSTGEPKGVKLSHENLLYNLALIHHAFGVDDNTRGVSWLPPYHDMGLIGGIIEPMYAGISSVLFSPLDFLQKPLRWLQAISKYKGTTSGAPNFAYDLCVRKAKPEILKELNLSSWTLAFSGAEPVQLETIRRFSETFAPCGFKTEAFYPCYGLAEATLIVSGGKKMTPIHSLNIDKKALEAHQVRQDEKSHFQMVACGNTLPGQEIKIVDSETGLELDAQRVGEIWVSGKSIAQGYWKKPVETEKVFKACLKEKDQSSTPSTFYLRTGDLGFLSEGELYVTGRIKDMMIFNGANHYPQDVELSIEKLHLPLRAGCGAAFSVTEKGEEKLILVWEVEDKNIQADLDQSLYQKIRETIATHHELHVHHILLVKKGMVPKTSSGKIQRHATKSAFLDSTLEVVGEWQDKAPESAPPQSMPTASNLKKRDHYRSIELWLIEKIAEKLQISITEVDPQQAFQSFGLDSKEAVGLSGELEDWLGRKVPPTLLWQYPNIESLAKHLSDQGVSHASGTYS